MCGIVGYVGSRQATPIVFEGLQRLEYRGYDSAGIAVLEHNRIAVRREVGKLVNLAKLLEAQPLSGQIGIGHTRWATHGPPTDFNAHPHTDPAHLVGDLGLGDRAPVQPDPAEHQVDPPAGEYEDGPEVASASRCPDGHDECCDDSEHRDMRHESALGGEPLDCGSSFFDHVTPSHWTMSTR